MSMRLRWSSCWIAFSILLPRLSSGLELPRLGPGSAPQSLSVTTALDPAAVGAPTAVLDLPGLLDRHWKTSLKVVLGGKAAYLSGSFDRDENAYVSVLVEGAERPVFFNLKGLMDAPGTIESGPVRYQVTLSANSLKPMKSKVVIENAADENDVHEPTIKQILEATTAAGQAVSMGGQVYKVFYFQTPKSGPAGAELDPKVLTFAFVLQGGEDFDVFLIPAELIPSDRAAVFKMKDDRKVGLKISADRLEIFDLP